jgi:ribosome-associated toxin RatA of RatAB toxin-antitoxin module
MKNFRHLPLVTLLALASGNALASSPTDVTRFDTKLPGSDRPAGGARTVVSASPEVVKSVVLDFEHYAYYFDPDKGTNPQRKWASHVVGRSGDKTDLYLEVPILKGAAKIWAVIRFDAPQKVSDDTEIVNGRMIKGNVSQLSAKWKMRRAADKTTELQLEFLVVPKVPIPDSLLSSEARSAASKAVTGMRGEALKRAGGS